MTAVTYLNVGTRTQIAAATSRTPALPGSRTNGNVLLLRVWSKNNAAHSISGAGWLPLEWSPGVNQIDSGSGLTVSYWYRVVDGTETTATVSWAGSVACGGQVTQFLRDDESAPVFGFVGTPTTGTTSTHTSTGQNTTANNSLVFYDDVCAANTAIATPSGWTERYDAGNATGASRNAGGTKAVATSGTASGNISVTGGAAAWVQVQIEFREPVFAGDTYTITNTADDGCYTTSFDSWVDTQPDNYIGNNGVDDLQAGFRFQGIAIPQGATIANARLRLRAGADPATGSVWGFFYGDDVDNAAAWSSSSYPGSITPTTASIAAKGSATDSATLVHDVTSIVQELVNRPGWSSGNSMRFGGLPSSPNGYATYYDYSQDPTKAAQLLVEYTTGGGGSALTPSLVTNSQTFFAPTVTRGAVTLAPSLLTNAQSFYAATLTANYTLAPPQIPSATAFFGPTVQPGAVTLAPARLVNGQTFYAPTVQADAVLAPSLLTNSQTFPAPTVTTSYALTAPLLTNTSTLFAPIVSTGAVIIVPPLLSDGDTFFAPTVTPATVSLSAPLLTNPQTIFGPVVTSDGSLSPPLLNNAQAFFAASITAGAVQISPPLITDGEVFFGGAVMVGLVELKPGLHTNDQAFFGPSVSVGPVDLAPPLVANDNHFYAAEIVVSSDQQLEAPLVTNVIAFPSPAVRQFRVPTGGRPGGSDGTTRPATPLTIRPAQLSASRPGTSTTTRPRAISTGRRR